MKHAYLGGGCFWCTEAAFKLAKGVVSVMPGYAGGTVTNPSYDDVCDGNTGHAEIIKIEYDPSVISFKNLLKIFFVSHDPTTLNRQGNDVGTQYRSVIFYTTEEEKKIAEETISEINQSAKLGDPVVTEISPLTEFYPAENYHHDYYSRNKEAAYCQFVINPKLEKVQSEAAELLK
jgi:peptide-methionine (S)-S-oxide reductase